MSHKYFIYYIYIYLFYLLYFIPSKLPNIMPGTVLFFFLNMGCFSFLAYTVSIVVEVFLSMYLWVRMFGISWQIITSAHNCPGHVNINFPLCISDGGWASQTGGPEEIVKKIMIYLEILDFPRWCYCDTKKRAHPAGLDGVYSRDTLCSPLRISHSVPPILSLLFSCLHLWKKNNRFCFWKRHPS